MVEPSHVFLNTKRNKTTVRMEKKNPLFLPHDLIIQILLRLPVNSLISLKCVCKSWFSLISHDIDFANSNFELTSATHTRRIMLILTPPLKTQSIDIELSLYASASMNNNFLCPQSYFDIEIKGSCRGFILLHFGACFYLWNPSIGRNKQIPLSPNDYIFNLYGFGYDHATDDYLVVSISRDQISNSDDVLSHLWLFSLRANVWQEIACTTRLPFYTNVSSSVRQVESFFNGAIHWLAFRHDISDHVIVAFHLTERKLLEILLPVDINYNSKGCGFWVFRGFLSLWILRDDEVDIWVMKEYKVHSSWTKTLVLPIYDDIPYFCPLSYTKSGDIIGTDGGTGLVKYNDKGEILEHNSYCEDARGFRLAMYTESLLSLPNDKLTVTKLKKTHKPEE
jgi:F-box interacting protein